MSSAVNSGQPMPCPSIIRQSDAAQRQGLVTRYNYVGTGQGTVFRILEMAPGAATLEHRTETLDYGIVLSGEGELHLDGGEVVHMKAGDVIVNRGAMHDTY